MKISQSTQIKDSVEKIWNTLSAFDGVERYFPIVTRSEVDGNGPGAKRTCNVSMGNQEFEMCESLQSLVIFTDVENPDAGSMAKSIFALIGQGLKKFHEL